MKNSSNNSSSVTMHRAAAAEALCIHISNVLLAVGFGFFADDRVKASDMAK